MHNIKEHQVWKRAIDMVKVIYQITSNFPSDKKFGIISQIRRSAVSIPSNISEGVGRKTDKDFSNFLSMSLRSQYELERQLIISEDFGFISDNLLLGTTKELNEIQKMTRTLISKFSNV
ncbi:four helix bundle protein [Ekhidna sp. To15]|uniref:four helix bundle protein n=1 Tax=Ekhidna sp. To15 TaxID=3395267 RepID=UPI003F521CDF